MYPFGTPYEEIEADLTGQDAERYAQNGMLEILARNRRVKRAPERWQEQTTLPHDVVVCFDPRVYDRLVEDCHLRGGAATEGAVPARAATTAPPPPPVGEGRRRPMLIINLDVKDTPAEAKKAGGEALALCRSLDALGEDWAEGLEPTMDAFMAATARRPLYTVVYVHMPAGAR